MYSTVDIAKAPKRKPPKRPRTRAAQNAVIATELRARDAREAAFSGALAAWLQRFARFEARRAQNLIRRHGLNPKVTMSKAKTTRGSLERELLNLYQRFGLQQIEESGRRWSSRLGGEFVWRPEVRARHAQEIENKVVLLFRETEKQVRDSLQTIIQESLAEFPRPSVGEVRRRISNQWHGQPTQEEIERGSEAERKATAEWRRRRREGLPPSPRVALAREHIREGEQEALFSPARALAIARTELGDADTAGAAEGFAASGVERVGWSARPDDGRSGKREHYKMNRHKPITIEDIQSGDSSRWFKLPSGARGRRPLDPLLPVGERVNCRCALIPVR